MERFTQTGRPAALLTAFAFLMGVSSPSLATDPPGARWRSTETAKPLTEVQEGSYRYPKNSYFRGDAVKVFKWHDGKKYLRGNLSYNNYTLKFELPLAIASDQREKNHFIFEGKGTDGYCEYTIKGDLFSYEEKIYLAVFSPERLSGKLCQEVVSSWVRYELAFELVKPLPPEPKPEPKPEPVPKPKNSCRCVTAKFQGVDWCVVEPLHQGYQGVACTADRCRALMTQFKARCEK